MTEIPRPVPGYSGMAVTSDGVVYGPSGQPLKRTLNYRDQLTVPVSRGTPEGRKRASVVELVCVAFHGPRPSPDHWAKNLNRSPWDIRPETVAWVLKRSARTTGA